MDKTPFEYWYNKKPIYTNLKRFGADCYVKIPDENRRKLDSKALKGILLGVDMESKAYRIYIPGSRKVVISRDVKFLEENNTVAESPINVEIDGSTIQDNSTNEDSGHNQSLDYESATENSSSTEEDINQPIQLRHSERSNKAVPPQQLIEQISMVTNGEPTNFEEAISCHDKYNWINAMQEELSSLEVNGTWKLVTLPENKNLIGCKWVYKLKTDASS